MTKFDVYGIGNALVDKEFEVTDKFFADHAIEKGMMTLVDEAQQDKLLHALENNFALKSQAGGGSAANTLYALSQFGGNAFLSCRVANDENGDFYLSQLGTHNIETNTASQRGNGKTGRCLVMISPDAERTMLTYLGASGEISTHELDLQAAQNSRYVYLEGYLVTSPDAKAAVIQLKKFAEANGVNTAMTFSDPAMVEYFQSDVNDVLGDGVDLLFCNEREALIWSATDSLQEACTALKQKARRFAITRGSQGALLFDGQQFVDIAAHPVKAIDTNGAGDMFAGAFLYALTQQNDFPTAGKLASLAAATTVSHFGPRLPPEKHQHIIKQLDTPKRKS
ncbi:MAG: adenosine kinase [Pseudohongiellaceae bacterium]